MQMKDNSQLHNTGVVIDCHYFSQMALQSLNGDLIVITVHLAKK